MRFKTEDKVKINEKLSNRLNGRTATVIGFNRVREKSVTATLVPKAPAVTVNCAVCGNEIEIRPRDARDLRDDDIHSCSVPCLRAALKWWPVEEPVK